MTESRRSRIAYELWAKVAWAHMFRQAECIAKAAFDWNKMDRNSVREIVQ